MFTCNAKENTTDNTTNRAPFTGMIKVGQKVLVSLSACYLVSKLSIDIWKLYNGLISILG